MRRIKRGGERREVRGWKGRGGGGGGGEEKKMPDRIS